MCITGGAIHSATVVFDCVSLLSKFQVFPSVTEETLVTLVTVETDPYTKVRDNQMQLNSFAHAHDYVVRSSSSSASFVRLRVTMSGAYIVVGMTVSDE